MQVTQQVGGSLTPYAYENITVNTSIGFTSTLVRPVSTVAEKDLGAARLIVAQVEGAEIRYRYDGGTPVATSSGHLAAVGTILTFINLQAMLNFRAVKEGGSNATLRVTYSR